MSPLRSRFALRVISVVLGLGWLINAVPAWAQAGGGAPRTVGASHSVRGKVYLPSGQFPEQRVRVVLEISTGGIAGETFSDSAGNFEFRAVGNGNYILKVTGDGRLFDTTQEALEISGSFARNFTPQIYLREREAERSAPKNRLLSVADAQEVPKAAKQSYEKGLKLLQANQSSAAIEQFQMALKVFPVYLSALNKLGEQYLQLAQLEAAQAYFERALATNARFAPAHIGLGTLLAQQQKYAEAIAHLEAANQSDDSYPSAHIQLGLALMENKPADYVRAEKELLRGLALGGKNVAYVYMYLFNLYKRLGQYPQAAAQLEAFLREKPEAPEAPQVRQRLDAIKKVIAQTPAAKQD